MYLFVKKESHCLHHILWTMIILVLYDRSLQHCTKVKSKEWIDDLRND